MLRKRAKAGAFLEIRFLGFLGSEEDPGWGAAAAAAGGGGRGELRAVGQMEWADSHPPRGPAPQTAANVRVFLRW